MLTIQVVGIQRKGQNYVRVFGHREDDAAQKLVEVALPMKDAFEIARYIERGVEPIEIEVPNNAFAFCTSYVPLGIQLVPVRKGPA